MKNIIKSFLLSIAAIPLFASCAQDNFSAPKGESLVFTATIANATRTSIDIDGSAGKVNWVAGDEILINGVAYVATPDPSDATKATFEKKNASDADAKDIFGEYYATYRCTFDPETGEGIIPAKQVCTAANMLPAPMVAVSENTSLSFLNICGVLEINLKGTKTVKDIEVSADNIGLSGKFTVLDGQSATIIDNEKGSVTLDCGDGIALTSEGTKFYVPVPAGEYTGLKISVHTADNNSWSTTAVRTATVEANKIYSAEFTPEFVGSPARYSNDGGATWTYAESLAAAINGITTTAKADGKVELLKDCTIESQVKISGKKFIWNGNGHTVSFVSKYDEFTDNYQGAIHVMSSSDVDFTDTKFVGQGTSETATDRPFAVVASTASFGKDVTISDFKNSRPYGGAIWGNKQSVIYLKDNLKITNCHNAPASSSYGGGALCSDGSVYVQDDVLISGCSSAFWGGAILSNYNNETSKLIMSGRARIENCKSGKGGGGFYGNGNIELSDEVTISGCQAGTCGGAFEARKVTALSGKVLVENCTAETVGGAIALAVGANLTLAGDILIKDCTSKTHGGGICNTGTTSGISIEMKGNAHITGCKALDGDGGGIRDNATASTMTVSENALIDNCSCTGKGGGLYQAGTYTIGGNVRIENCSAKNGGGIAVWKNATLDENVLIKGCTATDNGGGVFVTYNASNTSYGQLTIQGNAKIEDCSAAYGGGIYTDNISVIAVTMTGNASVINCLAKASGDVTGGAVYSNAMFTANGNVLFSGNDVQSANSGAIIAAGGSYGNVTISGGTFVSNSSSNSFAKAGSCSITLDGGYFNKAVDGATVKSGYVFGANPNTSAEDKAAYALGCIYKVVAP